MPEKSDSLTAAIRLAVLLLGAFAGAFAGALLLAPIAANPIDKDSQASLSVPGWADLLG